MKIPSNPDWIVSRLAITALIGTFIGIFVVERELNLTFALWYLSIVGCVVACNWIFVISKRKNNSDKINVNEHS